VTLVQRIADMRERARRNEKIVPGALIDLLTDVEPIVKAQEERLATVLRSLSYMEEQLLRAVVEALPAEDSGVVKACKVAQTVGASRSALSIALHKLQAAGLAQIYSMGMKGTHIKLIGITRSELLQRLARTA